MRVRQELKQGLKQGPKGVERNYLRVSGKLIYFPKNHIWKYCYVYKICLKVYKNHVYNKFSSTQKNKLTVILFRTPYLKEWLVLCPVIWEIGVLKVFPREKGPSLWSRFCQVVWQTEGQDLAWAALWWWFGPVHPNPCSLFSYFSPFVSVCFMRLKECL